MTMCQRFIYEHTGEFGEVTRFRLVATTGLAALFEATSTLDLSMGGEVLAVTNEEWELALEAPQMPKGT